MTMRLPFALVLLLAAAVSGHNPFTRSCCGCLRNPTSAELTKVELSQLRGYVQQSGVTHYEALTDYSLQAIFRNTLMNNYHDVVPASRESVLQVVKESFSSLTDTVVPSVAQCGQIAGYLTKSVPQLAAGGVNIDLRALVASTSVVLHQRGVAVSVEQFNILLKYGLMKYLSSTVYQSAYTNLKQLIATLDYIDHDLHILLSHKELIAVRRQLELRFKQNNDIFDNRYKLAISAFRANRLRLLATFNTLAYRGPSYEVNIQYVIKDMVRIFPGLSSYSVRTLLNVLQITNTASGLATPKDLLAMVSLPKLKSELRVISETYIQRIYSSLKIRGVTIVQIREAYTLFVIGLASQGIQPVQALATYELFALHMVRFLQATQVYSVQEYFLYVIRVVVAEIPRGSPAFQLYIYDSTVIIENVIVPAPWVSMYTEGRESIIGRLRGLQGSSNDITKRLITGTGEQGYVKNIVKLKPAILPANTPGYDQFEYQNVILSGIQMKQVADALVKRFNYLKRPSLQLPLLRILVRAKVIPNTGARAALAFRQLFQGLPAYSVPSNLGYIIKQLGVFNVQLTQTQLSAGLQQFYVASRCLGYVIPAKTIPSVFLYTIREYMSTLTTIPTNPFGDNFLEFLYLRLAVIIRKVSVVEHQVPIDDYITHRIFSVFKFRISVRVQRTIIRYIHSANLLPKSTHGVSVVDQYQSVLKSLFGRYPVGTFILSVRELKSIRIQLSQAGIRVTIKQLREVNIMAYCGLGFVNRIKSSMTVVQVRQIVYTAVSYFVRVNKVSNIPSTAFFHFLMKRYKVPTPRLPVFIQPVVQYPKYYQRPVYILPGISLSVKQVQQLVVILRARFEFVSVKNVRSVLAHTILILRAQLKITINQNNCYNYLYRHYSGLPKSIALRRYGYDQISKITAPVSGYNIQSALMELYIHMYYLKMSFPSPQHRYNFLGYCIRQYVTKVRRQPVFGGRFYYFLKNFLPKYRGTSYRPCGRYGKRIC